MAGTPIENGLRGKRVIAFESRMAEQMRRLITKFGGDPLMAMSMREVPLEENTGLVAFGKRLHAGEIDMIIFLTGVGARIMLNGLDVHWPREQTIAALRRLPLVARGPKPVQVLREAGLTPTISVLEPNTWHNILHALREQNLAGMSLAVQEYGVSNPRLLQGLRDCGASVESVPVYRWALPEDLSPLMHAIRETVSHRVDVVLFTSAVQVEHLMQVAERDDYVGALRHACSRMMIGSIGPMSSERLHYHNLPVDFEPTHSKMGIFVKEASEHVEEVLLTKRVNLANEE